MSRKIKFRVWDKKYQDWIDTSKIAIAADGDVVAYRGMGILSCGWVEESGSCKHNFVFQQFTGYLDQNGIEIYEGDIIKFRYWVGDFAWQEMDDKEALRQKKMLDKEYTGTVAPASIGNINLEIVVGKHDETHMIFPLAYAASSRVIGNIFENPELLK